MNKKLFSIKEITPFFCSVIFNYALTLMFVLSSCGIKMNGANNEEVLLATATPTSTTNVSTSNGVSSPNTSQSVLTWIPLTQNFGNINVATNSASQVFTLINFGGTDASGCAVPTLSDSVNFTIVSDTCATNDVSKYGGTCATTIQANPTTVGLKQATLSRLCTVGGSIATTTNQIQVTGVNGVLTWAPLLKNFGNINVGSTSSVQVFTLSNTGGADATGCAPPTLTDTTNFTMVTDSCGTNSIPNGGGSCFVTVQANPATSGIKQATLSRVCTSGGTVTTNSNQIQVTGSVNPSNLGWLENSPSLSNVVNAAWDPSSGITNQKIQFYSDSSCTTTSGATVDLLSATKSSYTFTGSFNGTYTYKITSVFSSTPYVSSCSTAITLSSTLAVSPLSVTHGSHDNLSQTFTASAGSGSGYSYSILSGPGSIDTSTGMYSYTGTRAGSVTVIQVADSGGHSASARIYHNQPIISGTVNAITADATHAYVGGSFSLVGSNIGKYASIFSASDQNQISAQISQAFNGTINAIVIRGNTAYLGGNFTQYLTTPVQNLVKIDLSTGQLDTTFTQSTGPNASVNALLLSGSSLYVGGAFGSYRGNSKGGFLAKLNAASGALETSNFNSGAGGPFGVVSAIASSGSALFVGGGFTYYRGDPRGQYLVKIDSTTGTLDTTNFNASYGSGPANGVLALTVSGSALFVGGTFSSYGGDARGAYLAKVDAVSGALDTTNFNSMASANSSVYALAISGSSVYAGGNFSAYRGDNKAYQLAKIDTMTGVLDTANFNTIASSGPSGTVYSLVASGSSIYVGGQFTAYRGSTKGSNLIKIDASTGALDTTTFNSVLALKASGSVLAVAVDGSYVGAVGNYTQCLQGTAVQNLAKFNLSTGDIDTTFSQSTGPSSTVYSLAISGTNLYVGGSFTGYRGDNKGYYLAKVDTTTGALDTANFNTTSNSGPNNWVNAIVISGTSLYLGGNFTSYRGDAKGYYLAKVDTTTGALDTVNFNTTANAGPNGYVSALAISGSSLYAGGNFSVYRGNGFGSYLIKVDATTGILDSATFNTTGTQTSGAVAALAISGGFLYAGGAFSYYRGDSKGYNLIKVNATTGVMDIVNFNTTVGGGPNSNVNALVVFGTSLYVGGNFTAYRSDSKGYYLARVDTTTGALDTANFNTVAGSGPNSAVGALTICGSSVCAAGGFTTYRGNSSGPYVTADLVTGVAP